MFAYFSCTAVCSFSGFSCTMVATWCVRSNELTFLHQAFRDRSAGGSSNRCIRHLLFREFIAGTAILQACLQGADILQSGLHRGLRNFEARVVGIKIGSRGQPLVDQFLCLRKLDAGILSIGDGCSDGCDLLVGRDDVPGAQLSMPS